jgi:hypothetical protein
VTPYTLALAAAATLQLGLTVFAWQHRDERLSVILGGLLVAAAIWCLAYAMQLSSGDAPTAAFWNDVRLLGRRSSRRCCSCSLRRTRTGRSGSADVDWRHCSQSPS